MRGEVTMAFPTVEATATSGEGSNTTNHSVSLPAGIAAGDLLVAQFCVSDTGTITWPAGWTRLGTDYVNDSSENKTSFAYRKADGSEGSSITVTSGGNGKSSHGVYRISGAEDPSTQAPEIAVLIQTNDPDPAIADPPELTPTGGEADFLWVAGYSYTGGDLNATIPADYSNLLEAESGGGGFIQTRTYVGSARRELTASSEDPGTFEHDNTVSGRSPVAFTVAIHPAGAGGTTIDTEAAEVDLRAGDTELDLTGLTVDTDAGRIDTQAGETSLDLGALTIDTEAAVVELRAAITSVDAGGEVIDTQAARIDVRAGVTELDLGEFTVSTEAARIELRAGITTVDAGGITVDTQAARLDLKAGETEIVLGSAEIDTLAGRIKLRAGVTSVEGGDTATLGEVTCQVLIPSAQCAILTPTRITEPFYGSI